MIILDFSKAFDTVPHGKLLHKMKLSLYMYGVDGNINSWLSDFLTNRKMKVVVDGEESDSVTVDSGVPQGTVLGPLLFLCHINDLPDAVKSGLLWNTVPLFGIPTYKRTLINWKRCNDGLPDLSQGTTLQEIRVVSPRC